MTFLKCNGFANNIKVFLLVSKFSLTASIFFIPVLADAQLDRGTWLVGGTGNFRMDKDKIAPELSLEKSSLSITPRIGHFFISKLAAGAALFYSRSVTKTPARNVANSFGIGPFVRYYILPASKRLNLLVEPSFIYSIEKGTGLSSTDYATYAFNAGPTVFLNSNISIELLLGYQNHKVLSTDIKTTSFLANIGLQIYLEHE